MQNWARCHCAIQAIPNAPRTRSVGLKGCYLAARVALDLTGLTDCESHGQPYFFDPEVSGQSLSAISRLRLSCSASATGGWQLNPEQTTAADFPSLMMGR